MTPFLLLQLIIIFQYSYSAQVNVIDWTNVIAISKTTTTLQVVSNALLTRQSGIHDETFKSLANLNADFVRFVPWYPYPRLGVPQLYPPSGSHLCGHLNGDANHNNWSLSITCPSQSVIKTIDFASWGTPFGNCGNFSVGKCHAQNSRNISEQLCLNKNSCTIRVDNTTFNGDPCEGTVKQFDIQVECSISHNYSNWDFTLIDPMMEDFMNATNPKNEANKTVINFSTIPNWKYQDVEYGEGIPDSPFDCAWSYNKGTNLTDPTVESVGEYYGNLVSYYKNGEFTDKYGNKITSPYKYNIDIWEVLNEPNAEHHNTPQSYTVLYDHIVSGIQKIADPEKKIKFMGLALSTRSPEWFQYFLNSSNHQPGIPIDYISFHFYTKSSNRTDPNSYQSFFPAVDGLVKDIPNIIEIRDNLSPNTKIDMDEIGVILPDDKEISPNPPPIYWNAAAAMFAYLFPQLAIQGIDILGESQLMGYPEIPAQQFPANEGDPVPVQHASVTLIDWESGQGNARYWVLKLLIDHFGVGDKIINTTFTDNDRFYAQGFIDTDGNKKILIVNKVNNNTMVTFNGVNGGKMYVIDLESGNGPAYVWDVYNNVYEMRPYSVGLLYL